MLLFFQLDPISSCLRSPTSNSISFLFHHFLTLSAHFPQHTFHYFSHLKNGNPLPLHLPHHISAPLRGKIPVVSIQLLPLSIACTPVRLSPPPNLQGNCCQGHHNLHIAKSSGQFPVIYLGAIGYLLIEMLSSLSNQCIIASWFSPSNCSFSVSLTGSPFP